MGKSQRQKGYRGEYTLVKKLRKAGLDAKRVPLSGATDFQKGDVVVQGFVGEVKVRQNGFMSLYKWLGEKDFLAVKADRKEYLIVLPLEIFAKLVGGRNEIEP